jgi:hydrogenase maturation protein HypF
MATVLALGAWLKNAACLRTADDAVHWSPLHGDLGTPQACMALEASAEDLLARAGGRVEAVAHDLHPDFHSTRLAIAIAARLGVPAIGVQHHHAHIAVVMAERALAGPVVGIALDGVGLGSDGSAWGGELLWLDGAAWRRLGHLQPLALPGGDAAAREPWRMAAAALHALGRGSEIETRFAATAGAASARMVARMLERQLNCPSTTSAGRWFDAAAGALGLSMRQAHEAEAAMMLERVAREWLAGHPPPRPDGLIVLDGGRVDLRPLLARLFELSDRGAAGEGAALFHVTLADALARAAQRAAREAGTRDVVLGGGCFYNALLTARIGEQLSAAGLDVRPTVNASCGDAGLALGQAWVASEMLAVQARPAPVQESVACA